MPDRTPRPQRARAAVTALLLLSPLAACSGGEDRDPAPAPSGPGTPLASYDTSGLSVARSAFCDRVPVAAVAEAVAGETTRATAWADGERARLGSAGTDVAHEFGCAFAAKGGPTAAAWVFAPPVTQERARVLVREASATTGCVVDRGAPAYGTPSVALTCREGEASTASFRGLFGDAWLTCAVTTPAEASDLPSVDVQLERAGRWCVAVAEAAAAS